MNYIKLIIFFLFLTSFTTLSADELIKPDNEAIVPDNEPVRIDLESIKKDIDAKKIGSKSEKKKAGVKPEKPKSEKKAAVKKKAVAKIKKEKTRPGKPLKKSGKSDLKAKKSNEKGVKTEVKSAKNKAEEKKIDVRSDNAGIEKTDRSLKKDILSGSIEVKPEKADTDAAGTEIILQNRNTIIINPSSTGSSISRLYGIDYAGIAKWGKPRGLKIKADAPPVIDGMAFYTPDYSAEFRVEGYDRERDYRLFIDFVKYEGKIQPLNSLLKIWGRGASGKMFLVAEINQNILAEDKIFETLIPYELSSPGRFDIIVREYSDTPGKWGIWDMIVTDKRVDLIEIIRPDASEKMKEIEPKIFK